MGIQGRITAAGFLASVLTVASSAFAAAPEAVPGEFIVKLKPSIEKMSTMALSSVVGAQVKSTIPEANIVVVKRPAIEMADFAVKSLADNPNVEYVEPNYIYRINKLPNDPSLEKLWGLKNNGSRGTAGVDIGAEEAWDITQGSEDVVIAVIDTGVNYRHQDLKENMWVNVAEANGKTGVDDDNNGFIDDINGYDFSSSAGDADPNDGHGHGSHCSGTIGARGDDGKGIVGVNWRVKIMAVKFLSDSGSGTLEGAIKSVNYATKMGAKIMSNSWGGGGESQALKEAIVKAHEAGSLFVAAAGNDGSNNDSSPHFPSNYNVPNVVSVAALDNRGMLASFSNYGKRTVHVAAPGVDIYSSTKNQEYASWSGTSMATPHVSGIAGLLLANEPNLTNVEIKARLMATSKPLASLKNKVGSEGITNAYLALTNRNPPPDPNDPSKWSSVSASVSSAHPYAKKTTETFELRVNNAKEISLYFQKFDTESGYDKVTLYNAAGVKVAELSGNYDDSYSPVIAGNYVKVVFSSDDSIEKYGFDISKIAYR